MSMTLDQLLTKAADSVRGNLCREPAGKPGGGQFRSCGKGGAGAAGGTVAKQRVSISAEGLSAKLIETGGFTYQPTLKSSPKAGFAVSPFRDAETVFDAKSITEKDIFEYLKKHRDRFQDTRVHVGGWHDKEAGKVYLDLSVVVKSRKEAFKLAREHNQEGFYDLKAGQTVIVKEEGERRKALQAFAVAWEASRHQRRGAAEDGPGNHRNFEDLVLKAAGAVVRGNLCRRPAGPGGGQFVSCGAGGKGGAGAAAGGRGAGIAAEEHDPPPPGKAYTPKVTADPNKDGVTDAARVGVPGMVVPPPPAKIPRMPNLTPAEREVERGFAEAFEKDPDGMASRFREVVTASTKPGDPPTFGTDDAKVLSDKWSNPNLTPEQRATNRAIYNVALHQTANAITKRAFVQHLDTLKKGDELLVTVGGCGAGKGYALKQVPEALEMKKRAKAVWDSAGDQNATENPWIMREAEKRGLKVNYLFVHADPYNQWAHPERGVVKRAQDPNDGRMVDAKVFADSYAIGARNHANFAKANANNPNAKFMFLENSPKTIVHEKMPESATSINRKHLTRFAEKLIEKSSDIPPRVVRGAIIGKRIWGNKS